ncbi:MAG: hypothetical protein L7H18_02855 [Candidatus Nealsonbacteria bacterium DGGOD1a]|jgi:TM2 domain-containing membrane protein YozV|nr:MAG: hypothetical protein L7H18_02855 [Candidatus Nealsonbacteria bacterium DGGOD1a]
MPLSSEEIAKIEEEERVRVEAHEKYTQIAHPKNGKALFLSILIPGLGQMSKGEAGKGFVILVFCVGGYFVGVIPGIIIFVWQLFDAYNYNKKTDPNNSSESDSVTKILGIGLLIIMLLALIGYFMGSSSN